MKGKFLIIRFSSIGDIVLTSTVLRIIKTQIENSEVHFVTKKKYAAIVSSNPFIDKVFYLEHSLSDLIYLLQKENYDYIIDLHQNIRSNRIKSKIKTTTFSFNKLNFQKLLLVKLGINKLPEKHIVERNLETLTAFHVQNDFEGLDYFIPENEEFNFSDLPEPFQKGYVAFVIAGTYFTKKLPSEKIIEICKSISFPVLLLGGKTESAEGDKIIAGTNGNVLNFAGKIKLNQSASLLKNARVVLTNDTGLMHIAAAYKKKILSFWGNTIPGFGMYPYLPHENSKILEIKNLKCRPCSKLGKHKCPKKHFNCMNLIQAEDAVNWIQKNF
jgi:ADP-heptose:LPS heptosyltransferase